MARPYNDELREAAARAVMDDAGFTTTCESLLAEAATGNPRVRAWVATADKVLAVVFPRRAALPQPKDSK